MTDRARRQSPFANEPARLPSLPTVRLDDPQMQKFVDALRVWIDARAGARDPYERGVTMRDLVELGLVEAGAIGNPRRGLYFVGGNGAPGGVLVSRDGGVDRLSIDEFAKFIMDTALFRDLMKSLDDPTRFDGLPDELKSILLKSITDEAAARGADIRRLESRLQEEGRSLAYKIDEVTAAVDSAAAGVRQTQYAFATKNSAIAGQVTQVAARLDGVALPANAVIDNTGPYANLAALQAAITSPRRGVYYRVDDPASADVDDILLYLWSPGLGFYLAGKANDDTGTLIYSAKLEEHMKASVDRDTGMEAQYTLKVQAGGAIGGFGIAATDNGTGGISSHFIVSADKFAVVSPGDTLGGSGTTASPYTPPVNRVPFGVDTVNNTIYINGNVRINTGTGTSLNTIGDTVTITGQQLYSYASDATTPTPSSITLTATLTGTLTTYDWEYHNGTSWVNLSGTNTNSTYALAHNNAAWSTDTLRVRCVSGSASDEITMTKVRDGTNSKTGWLTNEAVAVAAENDGTGYSLTGAGGTFKVYNGITDVTTSSTFNITGGTDGGASWTKAQNGLTLTLNETSGVYSLSGASWTSDTETFTLNAVYSGVTISKVYIISKAKKGAVGATGGTGATGERGSLTGYGTLYGLYYSTSWSDGLPSTTSAYRANRVISNLINNEALTTNLTTYTHLRVGDTVTLTDAASATNAITKVWAGNTSGWVSPGVVINGNLVVSGTIVGNALAADAIDGKTVTGATVRTAASGARAYMDSTGFYVKDSADVTVFAARTESGLGLANISATATGTLYGVYVAGATSLTNIQSIATGTGWALAAQNNKTSAGNTNSGGVWATTNSGRAAIFAEHGTAAIQTHVSDATYGVDTNAPVRATRFISTVGTGTAPITVSSTTLVSNLNAERLNGSPTAASGAWWSSIPTIGGTGVLEGPQYIDFHGSNTETTDYRVRLYATGGDTTNAGSGRLKILANRGGTNNVDQFVLAGTDAGAPGGAAISSTACPSGVSSNALKWLQCDLNGATIYIPYVS